MLLLHRYSIILHITPNILHITPNILHITPNIKYNIRLNRYIYINGSLYYIRRY